MGLSADPGDTRKTPKKADKSKVHPASYRHAPLDDP
jgi:hypothetical protein